ncbi:hypothetical protein [Fibrobacter sp. UWEL]|uniref:hypothetical protein n=1 Tax=Fibrobacter sp. UWEL TaxID=1896209 RepID=UPI000920A9D9|nr:hypothetical protein [Fibrobacter sp. UWEL]SHK44341.1 hypothetical protein SAMN05720468_10267 [Fibrobacter sp. UWEL]
MKRIVLYLLVLLAVSVFAEGGQVSKKELFSRARDVLKESLESGDTARAGEALDYLKANLDNGAPLTANEEYYANMGMHRYGDALETYFEGRRLFLDMDYNPYDPALHARVQEKDGLNYYLTANADEITRSQVDSLDNLIASTDIDQERKDLFSVLLLSELVFGQNGYMVPGTYHVAIGVRETAYADEFVKRAEDFVQKYPNSVHAGYLKKGLIPMAQEYVDFQKEPLKHKFYTGGYGAYYSRWWGGITGDASNFIKMDMGTYMLEFEMQFWRVNLGAFVAYGIDAERKYVDSDSPSYDEDDGYSIGFTAGFDVFDSKFLKVVPFIGIGATTIEVLEIDAHNHFLMGSNLDIRIWTTTPRRMRAPVASVQLRLKYMAKFSSYSDKYRDENGVYHSVSGDYTNHAFSVGLGIYWW